MSSQQQYDFLFKTVIVGDSNVGKTQILSRFIDNEFSLDSKPTVGVQFGTKTLSCNGTSIKNQIWDTAGQQRFRALTCSYYRGAVGAIVVFDLTKRISFQHVQKWIKEIKQYSQPQISILVVGNKSDLQGHEVKYQDIETFATNHKLIYVSTSAATGQNINLAFDTLMKQILVRNGSQEDEEEDNRHVGSQLGKSSLNSQANEHCTTPSRSVHSQTGKPPKRQKPKIQAFSVQRGNKIKLENGTKNDVKNKKNCC